MTDDKLTAKELSILRAVYSLSQDGTDRIEIQSSKRWVLRPSGGAPVFTTSSKMCDLAYRGYVTLAYDFADSCHAYLTARGHEVADPPELAQTSDSVRLSGWVNPDIGLSNLVCLMLRRLPDNRFEYYPDELDTLDPRDQIVSFSDHNLSGKAFVQFRPHCPPEDHHD